MSNSRFPIFSDSDWNSISEHLELSPRQLEVLKCLFDGMCDKEIAQKLDIAVPTVRMHIGRMFNKYGLQDRIELILHVVSERLNAGR